MDSQPIKDKGKVFRDPVHRLIRIEKDDQFILDLINTPEFQRLRRVRQLGVSSLTYHGAEHSRFVHSLGVFNFAQRIIAALIRRYGKDDAVTHHLQEHARVAKAAALLHDIGHGPFSHMIERADSSRFDHEVMTAKLIREQGEIARVLRHHDIDPESVASIIDKTYLHRLIVDIVSSQLDADRMDYLLRDSLMTGVEYGVFDAEWVLNAMCVGSDPGLGVSDGDTNPGSGAWRLCLDRDRGLFAAEQLILARHHMMLQVYMHRVTRGYEVMLLNMFRYVAGLAQDGQLPDGTPSPVKAYFESGIDMRHEDWVFFDETAMVAAIQGWASSGDSWLARMAGAYFSRDRVLEGHEIGGLRATETMKLQQRLAAENLMEYRDWGLDDGEHLPYKGIGHTASSRGEGEEQSTLSILLSRGDPRTKAKPSETVSPILKGLDDNRQPVVRLYIDRQKTEIAQPILDEIVKRGGAS